MNELLVLSKEKAAKSATPWSKKFHILESNSQNYCMWKNWDIYIYLPLKTPTTKKRYIPLNPLDLKANKVYNPPS